MPTLSIEFGIVLTFILLLIGIVIESIFSPNHRIWPPPKKDGWQQAASWAAFAVSMFGVPLVGILDFQSLGANHWSFSLVGIIPVALGFGIDLWGTKTLSAQQSLGSKGKIITEGPYKRTRNPQYVGFISIYVGIILITLSWMAMAAGLLLITAFLILPFSEEPWLRQQYGEAYIEYCRNVPRFIGLRSLKWAFQHR